MKKNIKNLIVIIFFYLFIFQNLLQNFFTPFKYIDEFLILISLFCMIDNVMKNKYKIRISKTNKNISICLMIIIIIGLISNIIFKYQPVTAVIGDLIIFIKFFAALYLGEYLKENDILEEKVILKHSKIIISLFTILSIANYALNLFPADIRFGIMSNKLFYSHTTYLASNAVILLAIIIKYYKKIFNIWGILSMLLLISTLRFKAIGCLIVFLLVYYIAKKNKKIISFKYLIVIAMLLFAISFNQISYYFLKNDDFARSALTTKSIQIANDYFPFGTGFGTYASHMTTIYYSPIYYKYDLSEIYGIQEWNTNFINDVFWPMILGQFGYFGFILYIICLFNIFKKIKAAFEEDNIYRYISLLCVFLYLIISSTSESSFVHPMSILAAIFIGYNTKKIDKEKIS